MTHPAIRRIGAMQTELMWLARNLPVRLDHLSNRTPDGWPAGTLGGSGGGGVARPTESAVIAGLESRQHYSRIDGLAAEAMGLLQMLVAEVQAVHVDVDTTTAARQARCSGGEGEWQDPACTRNAITRDGLCDACRQRRDHYRRKSGVAS